MQNIMKNPYEERPYLTYRVLQLLDGSWDVTVIPDGAERDDNKVALLSMTILARSPKAALHHAKREQSVLRTRTYREKNRKRSAWTNLNFVLPS